MAQSSVTDFANARFADDGARFAEDDGSPARSGVQPPSSLPQFAVDRDPARRGNLISQDVGVQGPVARSRFDGLTTAPERAITVDDALAARSGAVRR
jgi:hypothetical protein